MSESIPDHIRNELGPVDKVGFELAVADSPGDIARVIELIDEISEQHELDRDEENKLAEKRAFALVMSGDFESFLNIVRSILEIYEAEERNRLVETLGAYVCDAPKIERAEEIMALTDYATDPIASARLLGWLVKCVNREILEGTHWQPVAEQFYGELGAYPCDSSLHGFEGLFDLFKSDENKYGEFVAESKRVEATEFETALFRAQLCE